ncbi:uroplakin-3b [Rana temporaria]|uniref:uroplakin-3b n=1 Tax=Rana temporaria TaxID=8407 RepID=UPI001AAC9486|nr:uroplakin-3b [Rana temporaria]
MIISVKLWLLVSLSSVAADLTSYVPQLTNSPILGRVTTSTFALDKPQCLFGKNSSNTVWLVVATSTASVGDSLLQAKTSYRDFSTTGYYHTYAHDETFYNCTSTPEYMRVGGDSVCSVTDTYCNKYLPQGTYKVKFVVFNNTNILIDQTKWSNLITLSAGKDPAGIDTWPGGRSGCMIVITSILSVLLALVVAALIGAFIIGRKNLPCFTQKTQSKPKTMPQEIDLKNYKTHHVSEFYDLPTH